jgi:hypothetical protein
MGCCCFVEPGSGFQSFQNQRTMGWGISFLKNQNPKNYKTGFFLLLEERIF